MRINTNRIVHIISVIFYYIIGNLMCILFYNKKYITGKYFRGGKFKGIAAQGWRWATYDGLAKIFVHSNQGVPWPVSWKMTVLHPENIEFDPDDLHIFHTYGTYFQAADGKIRIGKGTWIAPNVGLITANHDIYNLEAHAKGKDINIGERCWIGMNAVILPGVCLGPATIVGAGAIVTHSFPEGNCVIAGNPAKIIKLIEKKDVEKCCEKYRSTDEPKYSL